MMSHPVQKTDQSLPLSIHSALQGGGDLGFSLCGSNFCLQDNFFDQSMNRLSNPLLKIIQKKKIISPHYLADHLYNFSFYQPTNGSQMT